MNEKIREMAERLLDQEMETVFAERLLEQRKAKKRVVRKIHRVSPEQYRLLEDHTDELLVDHPGIVVGRVGLDPGRGDHDQGEEGA